MKITRRRSEGDVPAPTDENTPVTECDPGAVEPALEPSDDSAFLTAMRQLFAEMQREAEAGDVIDTRSGDTSTDGMVR